MFLACGVVIVGLLLLLWSADRFVEGAASVAAYLGMPALLIGMVIVGFGTSAPELLVSAIAASQGSPGLALGNAYGSNIANIALILGITALFKPIMVHSTVLRKELPVLILITIFSFFLLGDLYLSRFDAILLLLVFFSLMAWTLWQGIRSPEDHLGVQVEQSSTGSTPVFRSLVWLVIGLVLLLISSRMLVWGASTVARSLGVSDMVIGLTVVAIGTSLPELASSLIAARKGEHDIALGNVLGSNLFNTLAVTGIAGVIHPLGIDKTTLFRDMPVMTGLTLALFAICYGFHGKQGRINRLEGLGLLVVYLVYTGILLRKIL